jgi:apolipoprotein N-acyltransferase
MGFFVVGVSWVYVSMHDVGGMPAALAALAVILFAAYLAAFGALAMALAARLRSGNPWLDALLAASTWALGEWLRGTLFTGFPWLAIGYADTGGPFGGFAPIAGVYGVGALHAFTAAVAARWLVMAARRPRRPGIPEALLATFVVAGTGLTRIGWTQPAGTPVEVALLQGNVAQDLKFVEGRFETTLALYRRLIEAHPATLTVLPETALPRMLGAIPPDYLTWLESSARARGGDVIVGVPLAESRERYFNSAVSLGTHPAARYDKNHLVPFGEFVPPGFRWFVDAMRIPLGDFTRGSEAPVPMALGQVRAAINICYEDLFGEEIIRQLPAATVLVNISNVAWFGDSLAPPQHLQISRMRALETGRPMLRATNTGMTAVIDARGRVEAVLPPFTEGALVRRVQGRSGLTPYAATGNGPIIALCLLTIGVSAVRRRPPPGRAPA